AFAHASSDRIGYLVAKLCDLVGAVVKDGMEGQNVSYLSKSLAQELTLAMDLDNNATDPLRELLYGIIETTGSMVDETLERRTMETAEQQVGRST
ncbi:hypothetical protein PENTCL1PPCAC_25928, partial [Pristionchus entomophagus]